MIRQTAVGRRALTQTLLLFAATPSGGIWVPTSCTSSTKGFSYRNPRHSRTTRLCGSYNDYLRRTTTLFSLIVWVDPPPRPEALTPAALDAALRKKGEAIEEMQLWPFHQWLCTARKDIFTCPPLSKDEIQVLDWFPRHHSLFLGRFEATTEALKRMRESGLLTGTLSQLLESLDTTNTSSPSSPCEPARTLLLICLRELVFSINLSISSPKKHKPTTTPTKGENGAGGEAVSLDHAGQFLHKLLPLVALASHSPAKHTSAFDKSTVEAMRAAARIEVDALFFLTPQYQPAVQLLEQLTEGKEVVDGV
ncbi:hypothetical protein JCM8547_003366 [Rhodosporidiobolus lusitaniae]